MALLHDLALSFWQAISPLRSGLLATAWTLGDTPMSWAEVSGCVLAVAMVVCNMLVNPWGWPLAMLSSALYALLFVDARLYGEASLQLFFIAMAGWGWWQWLAGRGDDGQALVVHRLAPAQRRIALLSTLAAWPLLGALLQQTTNSDVPYLDALPTVGSLTGQFLLGRKLIENWAVWTAVNLVSMILFAAKALWLTVGLYGLFTVLALLGWRAWQVQLSHGGPRA